MTESSPTSKAPERDRSGGPEKTTDEEPRDASASTCPECDGSVIHDEAQAEIHCQDCGCVVESEQIDPGPEWRAFDPREKDEKSRVGAPETERIHDRGLSTVIGWQNHDAYGEALSPRQQAKIRRLRTWDERFRAQDSQDRNLKHALGEIDRMASALGLPEPIRETASVLYRRALAADMIRGRSIEGMATAALYAGSRIEGVARSIDEIVAVSRVDELEVKRAYRYLTAELQLGIAPTNPEAYIARFASELGVPDGTERRARELIRAAVEEGVHSGRNPVGVAAAALYAAAKLTNVDLVQADVSEIAHVSEVTIRNRYTEILEAAQGAQNV